MASSTVSQLTPFFIILFLAVFLGLLHLTDAWPRLLYGRHRRPVTQPARPPDEEQGRTNARRDSWVSLETLPRYTPTWSSSTAPILPEAALSAYLPRMREGESPSAGPPRPITDLPSLDHVYPPAGSPRQQCSSQSLFVLGNDSTESLEPDIPPLDHGSSKAAFPRKPFSNDSTIPIQTEVADFVNPASTSTYFQVPAANSLGVEPFPFRKPLPLSLQPHTRIGTVQAHKPVVVSPVSPEADTATSSFVSCMVECMEKAAPRNVSSKAEPFEQSELPPSPLLNSVLDRISIARERWTKIDI